jgi:hypothetical protein
MNPFDFVVVHGLGFRQTARYPTGLEQGPWADARGLASATCWILPPLPWDTDVEAIAALIARNTTHNATIVGRFYSWGCGWLFPRLARQMHVHGRGFRHVALCDPVYRSAVLPSFLPLNPLSLLRSPRIEIPANVKEVEWTRQYVDLPRAHDLVAEDPHVTTIHAAIECRVPHVRMDEHVLYRAMCARSLDRIYQLHELAEGEPDHA